MPLFLLLVFFTGLLGVPIVFALAFGPFVDFLINGNQALVGSMVQRTLAGIGKFELLAVPLFILAGEIMNRGGITERIVQLSQVFVGRLRGGLAQVNIVANIIFAGISGSAVADMSALGSILIPAMEKDGYSRQLSTALTAGASLIGPIIPPSIIMIVYAYIMEVSIGALFAAGVIPGVLMGVGLMVMTSLLAKKHNFPKAHPLTMKEKVVAIKGGIFPALTPFIIMFGILSGVVSPTEAAIVAVTYALFLSLFVFRNMTLREAWGTFKIAGPQAAIILLIIGTAAMFSWVLTLSGVPQQAADFMLGITQNKHMFLLLINLFLLVVGMFLDAGPAILILGPIFAPALAALGIAPTHFAIVMCVNLTIGLATPPFGLVLFAASTISGLSVKTIAWNMLPFYFVHFLILALITYFPDISLFLPRLLGLPV